NGKNINYFNTLEMQQQMIPLDTHVVQSMKNHKILSHPSSIVLQIVGSVVGVLVALYNQRRTRSPSAYNKNANPQKRPIDVTAQRIAQRRLPRQGQRRLAQRTSRYPRQRARNPQAQREHARVLPLQRYEMGRGTLHAHPA